MKKIIHICFTSSAFGSFRYAIKNGFLKGEKVIYIDDDLSNGPINCINNIQERIDWCINIFSKEYHEEIPKQLVLEYQRFYEEINCIDNEDIYIWYGRNGKEMCGFLYTLSLLKVSMKNIYTINVSDSRHYVECINQFIPNWVGEIIPENLEKFTALKEQIELEQYLHYTSLWEKLKKENSILRIPNQNEVISVSEDYLDKLILEYTQETFAKSTKIVGQVLGCSEIPVKDEFIFWRIIKLINSKKIMYKGKFGIMREMEIKRLILKSYISRG